MNRIPVEDRLDIQEVVARYAFLCDTKQYDKIGQVFADDAVFDESILGMPVTRGKAAILELFIAAGASAQFMIHLNGNHLINDYTGSTASGTSHLHVEAVMTDGRRLSVLGYYADDYVKTAGRWLLKSRKLVTIAPGTWV
jgi:ketosteroid isomerase-like protein